MYQWYKVPIDYNENNEIQPKYADGYNITYFGDRPFQGYSGTIINDEYIVKIYATEDIHAKLQEQEDVVVLSEEEVVNILNNKFKNSTQMDKAKTDTTIDFEEWNKKFKVGL